MTILGEARSAFQKGDDATAHRLYSEALRANPRNFEALLTLGLIYTRAGRFAEAERAMSEAVAVEPRSPEAHYVLGCLYQRSGRNADALSALSRALAVLPDFPPARVNRGALLMEAGRLEEALADFDAALARNPELTEGWNNRGNVLSRLGRYREAVESYDRALRLHPGIPQTLINRATALLALGQAEAALSGYCAASEADPASAEAWNGRANALFELKRFAEAAESYEAALARDPAHMKTLGLLAFTRAYCCDWRHRDADRAKIARAIAAGEAAIDPFQYLALADKPAEQLACARAWSRAKYPAARERLWRGETYAHRRLRLAYVSADFREHAVAHLMAGVFAAHDRTRFETFAVSLARAPGDPKRARLMESFDHFLDADEMDDRAVAAAMRESEIDIAVDLMGYTAHARPGVFAWRPASVQALYLGFPGTMGADFIDALIADATVIPPEDECFFDEKIVRLADTYLATDDRRAIAPAPARRDSGLPERGFVFASFNNSYKFAPEIFAVWMRLLQAVEGSVLWLPDNGAAKENLKREARARGVSADRLVFARHLEENADHLARLSLAELFLDTLPYNAHTSAIDALWAGVPVLTCRGTAFAGRAAASALAAIGLPELITESLADYEAAALRLACDAAALADIRDKLARNRTTFPLFDTARFTRNLEAAFLSLTSSSQR